MDGASKDGTVELLNELKKRHSRLEVYSEKDKGQSDALRKALALVDTEYFGWLNADDFYLPNALERLLALTGQSTKPAIVYGDYVRVDADGQVIHRRKQPSFCYWDCLHYYMTIQNSAAIFSAEHARDCGGFDPRWQFAMDYDFVLRLAKGRVVSHASGYLAAFRLHNDSKTNTIDDVNIADVNAIRNKYSTTPRFLLPIAYQVAKAKVVLRMISQGCLPSRLESREKAVQSMEKDVIK